MARPRVEKHRSRSQRNGERPVFLKSGAYDGAQKLAEQRGATLKATVNDLVAEGLKRRGR